MVRAMTAKFYWELAKASGRMEAGGGVWRASIICGQAKCRVASLRAGAGVNPASAGRPIEGSIVKTSSSDPRDCHPSPSRPKYECLGNDHDARTIGTMFGGFSSLDALVVTSAR
jgi:hypothetical protein